MIKISKVVLFFFLMCSTVFVEAQNTTNSPYSKYGVGVLRAQGFTQSLSMGGIGLGLRSNKDINILNPAAHSALTITVFETGVTNNALTLSDGVQSQFKNNTYIDHLSFGMPVIMNKWGMGFGLLPYSAVGYEYESVVTDPVAGDVTYREYGEGGINKAYFVNAVQFRLDSLSLISFGVNGLFYFGNQGYYEEVIFGGLANAYNTRAFQQTSVADFGIDLGTQYQKTFKNTKDENYKLIIAATYSIATDLKSRYSETVYSYNSLNNEYVDTVSFIRNARNITQLPSQLGVGISFEKNRKWIVGVDYHSSSWGEIAANSSLFKYSSNYSLAAGMEFVPKYDAFNHYFKRVSYRFGARYNTSYILINNQDLTEYGITFGVGLPIKRQETAIPRLNFGAEYGKRGQMKNGLIQETFFNFSVGLIINDRWFIKRRYD